MDALITVLGIVILALVFSNIVMAFVMMSALKDTTLKLTALKDASAAETVADAAVKMRRPRRSAPPPDPRQASMDQWSEAFAGDLEAHNGNGVRVG